MKLINHGHLSAAIFILCASFASPAHSQSSDPYYQLAAEHHRLGAACMVNHRLVKDEKCKQQLADHGKKMRAFITNPDMKVDPVKQERLANEITYQTVSLQCPKMSYGQSDYDMKKEIALYDKTLERHRAVVDRKRFCRCRIDERTKAFGRDVTGHLYRSFWNPKLPKPKLNEGQLGKEKQIFLDCFEKSMPRGSSIQKTKRSTVLNTNVIAPKKLGVPDGELAMIIAKLQKKCPTLRDQENLKCTSALAKVEKLKKVRWNMRNLPPEVNAQGELVK